MPDISADQPKQYYTTELEHVKVDLSILEKNSLRYSVLRLVIFVLVIAIAILLFPINIWIAWVAIIGGISLFLVVVKRHQLLELELSKKNNKQAILENEINVITNFENSNYDGSKFVDDNHDYTSDLDIFGQNSLFGLINRCRSFHGLELLSNFFSTTPSSDEIEIRKNAISELELETPWRIEFLTSLFTLKDGVDINEGEIIKNLLSKDLSFASRTVLTTYRKALPLIWLSIAGLCCLGYTSYLLLVSILIVILNFRISSRHASKVGVIQDNLSKVGSKLGIYKSALSIIYSRKWKSKNINNKIEDSGSQNYISQLKQLEKMSSLLDYRLNVAVSIILNLGFLWDSRIVSQIESWGKKNKDIINDVLDLIGRVETLVSFATWNYNNPKNVNARVSDGYFKLEGKDLLHPLLAKSKAVSNDFCINEGDYISIITGSNMSGKSTFLRTLGINMVLGNCGAKVCASKLEYSLASIVTYMRIKDALEEDVSTFKAELIRVEKILGMMKAKLPVFILADEMLRGTNSNDKLLGSKAILKKIVSHQAYGVIATHDLDLTTVDVSGIKNYYFDISFSNGELLFDYKIKHGVCQSFNASFLLRKLGLEIPSK